MWFLWNILDYVPIIGTVKNTGEAVVAFYQGDSEMGYIKAVEAAVGGALDVFTFGTGTVVAAVFKESGKTVAKVFTKEVTKDIAVKAACATITKAVFVKYMERNNNPYLQLNEVQGLGNGGRNNQQNVGINIRFIGNQRQTGNKRPKKKNEKSTPKRGYHVINNDTVKMFKKLIQRFILGNGLSDLTPGDSAYITPNMQILQDYSHTLSQPFEHNIANVMVVNMDINLDDPNANIYGDYRQRLENAFLRYMTVIYNQRDGRPGFTEQLENDARNAVTMLVNEMITGSVFVDQTVRRYWCNEDVDINFSKESDRKRERRRLDREQMFSEARAAVEEMLRGLADKAKKWLEEIMQARDNYHNFLNNQTH